MEFEPFHSDDDEDVASFLSEKKKKEGSAKKKGKSSQLFRSEKKDKSSFSDSPASVKQKSVHGVVGPADYIFDQQGSPPANDPPPGLAQNLQPAPPAQQQNTAQWNNNQIINNQAPMPVTSVQPSHQPTAQWVSNQPAVAAFPQPMPNLPKPNYVSQSPTPLQLNFPPTTTISTKIERPHSSAALLQELQPPQSPTPFKQQAISPQKKTLLAQAMTASSQFMSGSVPNPQSPSSAHLTHQRNQSYSRAMSAPLLTKPDVSGVPFQANFDNPDLITQSKEFATSPIQEVTFGSTGSLSSPPLTPPPSKQAANEEFATPQSMNVVNHASEPVVATAWANFSASSSPQEPSTTSDEENSISRRISHGAESLPESIPDSTSSVDDEVDDSVWQINDEQREYYTNQFEKIQPDENDVIKGPQARDFFLKSNLPNEVLSRIWHLSDLDKDFGLNLNEFCIAMHLVVAVRHGVELPLSLPASLLPKEEADPFNVSLETNQEEVFQSGDVDEKTDLSEKWAVDFDGIDGATPPTENTTDPNAAVQTMAQPTPGSTTLVSMEARVQPVSMQQPGSPTITERARPSSLASSSIESIPLTPDKKVQMNATMTSPKLRHNSTPSMNDGSSTAIARPRAAVTKNVNLMDAQPWQLLPPPSAKLKQQTAKIADEEMSSNASISSAGSIEQTLVSLNQSSEYILGVQPLPKDDSDEDSGKLKAKPVYNKNLSKEKSRSIDSLRSDISESSEFSWRRSSKHDSRPRSFTGSSISESTAPQEKPKEFEIPPIPPPRTKGHTRASSLDLNQLFSAKASLSAPDLKTQGSGQIEARVAPPRKPPRTSISGKLPKPSLSHESTSASVEKSFMRPHPAGSGVNANTHRRSYSLDSEIIIAPPRKPTDGLVARTEAAQQKLTETPGEREKESVIHQTKEHTVRFADQPDVVISNSKSPMEKQMRKHELQARIRQLRSQNTTLTTLISQLDIEWKEVSEERISLDVRLDKLKQQELE